MRFSDYVDFKDFITKNNMTPETGLTFLENELKKDKGSKDNGQHKQ